MKTSRATGSTFAPWRASRASRPAFFPAAALMLLVLATPSAAAVELTGAEAGPVAVRVAWADPACADPEATAACVLLVDGDAGNLGDATITASTAFESIDARALGDYRLDAQGGSIRDAKVRHHPLYPLVNATWVHLNETGTGRGLVDFRSHHSRSGEWGYWFFLTPGRTLGAPFPAQQGVFGICPAWCQLDQNWVLVSDYEHLWLAPYGVQAPYPEGSDYAVERREYEIRECYVTMKVDVGHCRLLPYVADPLREAIEVYKAATPNVAFHVVVSDVTVAVGRSPERPELPPREDARPAEDADPPLVPRVMFADAPAARRLAAAEPVPAGREAAGSAPSARAAVIVPDAAVATTERDPGPAEWPLVASIVGSALLALLAALYSRIARSRLLNHPVRKGIVDALAAEPGALVATLAERLGVPYNIAKYHVRRLEAHGILVGSRDRQRRYFLAGVRAAPIAGGARGAARRVYEYLEEHREADFPTLKARLGLAPSTLTESVKVLHARGVCEVSPTRPRRVRLADG